MSDIAIWRQPPASLRKKTYAINETSAKSERMEITKGLTAQSDLVAVTLVKKGPKMKVFMTCRVRLD